jgi:hypothetical protein
MKISKPLEALLVIVLQTLSAPVAVHVVPFGTRKAAPAVVHAAAKARSAKSNEKTSAKAILVIQ